MRLLNFNGKYSVMILVWCKKFITTKRFSNLIYIWNKKTIYETEISSWHWIHDCIMMKYFHGVWKFTIQRGTKKISSTLFFFLQFTKINYQQSDKWSFYLLPFLLFEEYICYSWRRQNTEDNAWPTSRKEFQNVCL